MIKGVLLDVGGVVSVGETMLPGASAAIARLRARLPVRFVTNITRQSHASVVESLREMGIEIAAHEVLTPAMAARDYLERHKLSPDLLVHPDLEADFRGLDIGTGRAVVIGDAGDAFTYKKLNKAFRILARGGNFIALAQNRAFRDADGELSLDAGAFVAALEYASGRHPHVLGKPAREFFLAGVESLGCDPDEAVMVGDDAEFDVSAAIKAGLAGILVRTGKYAAGAEDAHDPKPTAVLDDISAAADWILARA